MPAPAKSASKQKMDAALKAISQNHAVELRNASLIAMMADLWAKPWADQHQTTGGFANERITFAIRFRCWNTTVVRDMRRKCDDKGLAGPIVVGVSLATLEMSVVQQSMTRPWVECRRTFNQSVRQTRAGIFRIDRLSPDTWLLSQGRGDWVKMQKALCWFERLSLSCPNSLHP
jgi:hypothetical protein